MARCPHCNEEIEHLNNSYQRYIYYDFPIHNNGEVLYNNELFGDMADGTDIFACPLCDVVLFTDEEDAIQFFLADRNTVGNPNNDIRIRNEV